MSLFREMVEEHLPLAEAYLADGEKLLTEQRARVAERKRRGLPCRDSERLLKTMEATHALHVRHVALLERDLGRRDYGPPTPYQPPRLEAPFKPDPY